MSHPNPSHDRENEYPSDHYKPSRKLRGMAKKSRLSGLKAALRANRPDKGARKGYFRRGLSE